MEDKNINSRTGNRGGWNRNTQRGSRKSGEPQVIGDVLKEYFQSNEPLAVSFRQWKAKREAAREEEASESPRLFSEIFRHTEPCIDLKLLTCEPGRIPVGKFLEGFLTRDGEYHFSFVQNEPMRKKMPVVHRNPHVYQGRCINVVRKEDGMMYPTFNRPQYSAHLTFPDFCRKAAEELKMIADLVEED